MRQRWFINNVNWTENGQVIRIWRENSWNLSDDIAGCSAKTRYRNYSNGSHSEYGRVHAEMSSFSDLRQNGLLWFLIGNHLTLPRNENGNSWCGVRPCRRMPRCRSIAGAIWLRHECRNRNFRACKFVTDSFKSLCDGDEDIMHVIWIHNGTGFNVSTRGFVMINGLCGIRYFSMLTA